MAMESNKDEAKIEKLRREIDQGFDDWIDQHMNKGVAAPSDEG